METQTDEITSTRDAGSQTEIKLPEQMSVIWQCHINGPSAVLDGALRREMAVDMGGQEDIEADDDGLSANEDESVYIDPRQSDVRREASENTLDVLPMSTETQ